MSKENVDRMRQSQAAFERGDKDAWRAFVHPDVEVVPIGDWPEGDIHGRDAVWDFFVTANEPWEPGSYELDEVSNGGDRIAARMRRELRGKSSGVEVEYDYWVVFTFHDGLVARAEWFEDRQEALEAARLGPLP
jgi:ketosteroid isomerase-like protein